MAIRESAAVIQVTATEWVARLDRGLQDAEQTALDVWLQEDPRHVGAFARTQAVWGHLDRAQVYATASSRLIQERSPFRRYLSLGLAACVVVSVLTALAAWRQYSKTHIETEFGQIQRLRLDDGSTVTLNTGSRLTIDYSQHARAVRLDRGEALFAVAHGDSRPFIVSAGSLRVRDLGTAFDVRRETESTLDVTVTQGAANVWTQADTPGPAVQLNEGYQIEVNHGILSAPVALSASALARLTAWVDGFIDLDGQTLAEAAAEFNRYNRSTLIVTDPQLREERIVGRFRAQDPRGFAQAAAAMLNAKASDDGTSIEISREPSPLGQRK
jgi:transmembrane sensor